MFPPFYETRPCFLDRKESEDVLSFYNEFRERKEICTGFSNSSDYDAWLLMMRNRKENKDLPEGYVRENFYLCYDKKELVGVFSVKFALTNNFLIMAVILVTPSLLPKRKRGYGTAILKEGLSLAKNLGFHKVLSVADDDNIGSIKIIEKNGGVYENSLFDEEEKVLVRRYWVLC